MRTLYSCGAMLIVLVVACIDVAPASAETPVGVDLAEELNNPIGDLISVPLRNEFRFGGGTDDDGFSYKFEASPVAPISLNENWNLISRTIIPLTHRKNFSVESEFGLGDINQQFYLTPKAVEDDGVFWGIGPSFWLPTATENTLGSQKFGVGVAAVALKQSGGLLFGQLVNHIRSVAGKKSRAPLNFTFFQSFLTYTTSDSVTYSSSFDATRDWQNKKWTADLVGGVSKLFVFGSQPVNIGGSVIVNLDGPKSTPDWGFRLQVTLVFPAGG